MTVKYDIINVSYVLVAQLNRASVSEAEGHGFDSRQAQIFGFVAQ